MSSDSLIDRRNFALLLGTACLAASAETAAADETPPAPKLPIDPPETPTETPLEVLLLTYLVRSYRSDHFDDQSIQGIFRDIRGDVARGRVLTEFPLKNADEPAFVFSAYRSPDASH